MKEKTQWILKFMCRRQSFLQGFKFFFSSEGFLQKFVSFKMKIFCILFKDFLKTETNK